ncbi:MAG: NFACT RNA binding domain-containing protein [Ignavibacteria bacterium]
MTDDYFILVEVAKFLRTRILEFEVNDIFTQEKNKVVIHLINNALQQETYLEYSVDSHLPYLILRDNFAKSRKNVLSLLKSAYGHRINDVYVYDAERVLSISLDGNLSLDFVFITHKNNLLVTREKEIVETFKKIEEENLKRLDDFLVRKTMKTEGELTVKQYINENYRNFGNVAIDVFYKETGIAKNDELNEAHKTKTDEFFTACREKYQQPEFILYKQNGDRKISLISFDEYFKEYEKLTFRNINDLLQAYIKKTMMMQKLNDTKSTVKKSKEIELKNIIKRITSISEQLKVAKNAEKYKVYGDYILANMDKIPVGASSIEITTDKGIETINLNPRITLSENAQRFFEQYKRYTGSVESLSQKLSQLEAKRVVLEEEIKKLDEVNNLKEIKEFHPEEEKLPENVKEDISKFRRFILNDDFEVWVGKDSESNDLLTMRYAHPYELWFHVRGTTGSHTVLKQKNKSVTPSKEIIETAASIAAYYSKARNATNVPVAYCERKYVKKRKGFREGSVVMEHEKVIFVKPSVPKFAI